MNWEFRFLDFLQIVRTQAGDLIFPVLSLICDHGECWIALAVLLLLFKKTRKCGLAMGFALILHLLLCNGLVKPLFHRIRPYDVNTAVEIIARKPKDFSFPSGHSSASWASAAALLFSGADRRLLCFSTVLAVLITWSRLYLYFHYPTDVLAGTVLGIAFGYAGAKLAELIFRRSGKE